jgi:anti-sigma factor RsiW
VEGEKIYLADEHGDKLIDRYLLGNLSDAECEQLEERFFADDQHFSQMLASEDELLDRYVSGDISAPERQRFEEHLLKSPRARQRLEVYRMLLHPLPGEPAPGRGGAKREAAAPGWLQHLIPRRLPRLTLQFSLTALAAALLAGTVWLFYRSAPAPDDSRKSAAREVPAQTERTPPPQVDGQRPAEQELRAETQDRPGTSPETTPVKTGRQAETGRRSEPRPRDAQLSTALPTIRLVAGLRRGPEAMPSLVVPSNAKFVRLVLDVGSEAEGSNRASLSRNNREEVWSVSPLTLPPGDAKVVTLQPPARLVTPGDYLLKLQRVNGDTINDLDYYYFRVSK